MIYLEVYSAIQTRGLKRWLAVGSLFVLASCATLANPDISATRQADEQRYVVEATALAVSAEAQLELMRGTAEAAQTYIAVQDIINLALLGTVRAGQTPTPEIVPGSAATALPGSTDEPITGWLQFTSTGTASNVRDSDGCASTLQTQFSANAQRIYVTTHAFNIRGGTQMRVEWRYGGELVYQENWTVPADDSDFCLWFYIEPATVVFTPGQWSARLYADGDPLEQEASFTIGEEMGEGG